jgi:ABC-type nitrate/sulfonate/bicarbonate transport system substrate-binding protein
MKSLAPKFTVILLLGALLTACSSGSGSEGGGDAAQPEFKVGFPTTPDFDDLMTVAAVDRLNQQGWNVEPVFFNDPETAFAALARDDTQIGFGAAAAALEAIQSGASIKFTAQQQGGAGWAVVAREGINACDDLADVRFALNSTGGATTSYAQFWISEECSPEAAEQIEPIYIPGSENRAAALTSGQIDATLLTPGDIAALETQAPGEFHVVVDFGQTDLGLLNSSVIAVNESFLTDNRDTVVEFLTTAIEVYREAAEDPGILQPYAEEQQVAWNDNVAEALAGQFERGEFDTELTINDETVSFTIGFFTEYGDLDAGLEAAQIMDAEPRLEAVEQAGAQDGS